MDKISFMKVDDLVITDEDTWGELVTCYIKAHPDAKGKISYGDNAIVERASLLVGHCEGSC